MLLLAVPGHAYMHGTTSKKLFQHTTLQKKQKNTITTVEFSHFVGVNYTWKICLPSAFSWQTEVTVCDPDFFQIRHRHTRTLAFFTKLKNWPCFQCYNFTLLKAWWAGWNITHLRYPWKLLSCFNEAQVIFVQVTQLKELIVGVREKLRGSVFCFFWPLCISMP